MCGAGVVDGFAAVTEVAGAAIIEEEAVRVCRHEGAETAQSIKVFHAECRCRFNFCSGELAAIGPDKVDFVTVTIAEKI